jgi:glycosyltransferase involved in cell wall biosynthesis
MKIKTVVTITPIAIARDSRTWKQAASVAGFGYRSIVFEGRPSRLESAHLPFSLGSLPPISRPAGSGKARKGKGGGRAPEKRRGKGSQRARDMSQSALDGMRRVLRAPGALLRFIRGNWLAPLRTIPPADIYYLHGFKYFPLVYLLCRKHRARYIYDAHDFYPSLPYNFQLRLVRRLEGICVRKAAAFVTVGEGIAGLYRGKYGRAATVIRNCHDGRLDRPPQKDIRQALGLSPEDFLLVCVSRPVEGRAVQEPIAAMQNLPPQVHLAFVGRGYEGFAAGLCDAELGKRVHFLAPVLPYEIVPFIRTADVALLNRFAANPNHQHALPNSFFQAVAAGLPLLYPDLSEIKRISEKHELGLQVDPRSPQSIAHAVSNLLEAPAGLAAYKRNVQRASEKLSWQHEETILRQVVESIADAAA